ncbi:MAG: adenylyl cyclase [Pseudomonadota bacterium]
MSLVSELRRRNVFRVAAAYAVSGWALLQVIDLLGGALDLPGALTRSVMLLLLVGLPIVIAFAWAFEVTPEGLKPSKEVDPEASIAPHTGQRLNIVIATSLVLVVGLMIWQQFAPKDAADTVAEAEGRDTESSTALVGVPANSVAVLPFADMSPDGDQEYFADGISEEILNKLAGVAKLKVAGRTSSFAFRGRESDLKEMAQTLNVAHILEGSVRKQNDKVRVTAQLIAAEDGYHLWSETFDGNLADIFEVQDEIAEKILVALTEKIIGERALPAAVDIVPSDKGDFRAYNLFLEARDLIRSRQKDNLLRASDLLDTAIMIDPNYAPPYAQRALVESLLSDAEGAYGDIPLSQALPKAIEFADKALELDSELADGHAVRGLLYLDSKDSLRGISALRYAVTLNPNHIDARNWLSLALAGSGNYLGAADEMVDLFETDPLYPPVAGNVIIRLLQIGDQERAEKILTRMRTLETSERMYLWARANLECAIGQVAECIESAEESLAEIPDANRASGAAFARMNILDFEGAGKIAPPYVTPYLLSVQGRFDDALTEAKSLLDRSPESAPAQIDYMVMLSNAGKREKLLEYFDTEFGTIDAMERELYNPINGGLPPYGIIADALDRLERRDDLQVVMTAWRRAIDYGRRGGADSIDFNVNESMWFAMQGNFERSIEFLTRAADKRDGLLGFRTVNGLFRHRLGDNTQYQTLVARHFERVNEERLALDLSPVVPEEHIYEF